MTKIPRNIKIVDDDLRYRSGWTVDAYLIKSSNFAIYNIFFLWININKDMKTLHVCIRDQNKYHWYKSKRFRMNLINLRYPLHFLISICSYSNDDSSQSNTVSTQFFHDMMKQNGYSEGKNDQPLLVGSANKESKCWHIMKTENRNLVRLYEWVAKCIGLDVLSKV